MLDISEEIQEEWYEHIAKAMGRGDLYEAVQGDALPLNPDRINVSRIDFSRPLTVIRLNRRSSSPEGKRVLDDYDYPGMTHPKRHLTEEEHEVAVMCLMEIVNTQKRGRDDALRHHLETFDRFVQSRKVA